MRLGPDQEGHEIQAQETGPKGGGFSLSPRSCSCAVWEAEESPRVLPPCSGTVVPNCARFLSKPSTGMFQSPDTGNQTRSPTPKVERFNEKKKSKK